MENLVKMEGLFDGAFQGKRVLLTGDTGFKGSWLAMWLDQMGAEVFGYSLPPKTPNDNFVRAKVSERITHTDGDITDFQHFFSSVKTIEPEIVFHLAAQPLVLESYHNPVETFHTNVMGTVHFLEICRLVPSIKVAINITSDKCYENNNWVWGYRETDPMGGKDPYSSSKGCAELISASYRNSFFNGPMSACIASVRAGNVIGGGDWAENRIVPDFFRAHIKGVGLLLRNPQHTRPWQHVLEPLSGYLHLASKLLRDGKEFEGGWNFGPLDSNHYTVVQLIDKVIAHFGSGTYKSAPEGDQPHEAHLLKLDISKATKLLGWRPVLDFEKTVAFTVNGYRADIGNSSDVYRNRIDQIIEYIDIARQARIQWAIQ